MTTTRTQALGVGSILLALVWSLLAAPLAGAQEPEGEGGQSGIAEDDVVTTDETADDKLVVLGDLPMPADETIGTMNFITVDGERRRMYTYYEAETPDGSTTDRIVEYDLEPTIPQPIREVDVPDGYEPAASDGAYVSRIDRSRGRILSLTFINSTVGDRDITVIDQDTLQVVERWPLPERIPGFGATGMTYSATDDRVYLVGELNSGVKSPNDVKRQASSDGAVTAVAALEGEDGSVAWVRPVPECVAPLYSYLAGSLIARARHRDALYFPCNGTSSRTSGLVRLGIDGDASSGQAAGFPVEFFPVPGLYRGGSPTETGIAGFDPATGRVFMQSLSPTTPGAFVFDGRVSAWVGFIAAENDSNFRFGFHPTLGHFYMGGKAGANTHLTIADGRASPVDQGDSTFAFGPRYNLVPDPGTGRVFASVDARRILVIDDRLPKIAPLGPTDYDASTADVPEGPNTTRFFSGSSGGFGADTRLVGSIDNQVLNLGANASLAGPFVTPLAGSVVARADLSRGHRGMTSADVERLDVGSFGINGSARAFELDDATTSDRDRLRQQVAGEGQPAAGASQELPSPFESSYTTANCLEPEGNSDPAGLGRAEVRCEPSEERGAATASFEAGYTVGGNGSVSVASSSFDSEVRRDDEDGTVTRTVSTAQGVELSAPGAGSITFGEVVATATTAAHGQTGTSAVRWTRTVSGVVVRSPDGETLVGPASCVTVVDSSGGDDPTEVDSCHRLADEINSSPLQTRIEVRFPGPEATATPKGAFAGIRETEADHLEGDTLNDEERTAVPAVETTLFMDGTRKSRLLTRLAAVRANSIYYITLFQPSDAGGGGTDVGLGFDGGGDADRPGSEVTAPELTESAPNAAGANQQLIDELSAFLSNVDPDALGQGPSTGEGQAGYPSASEATSADGSSDPDVDEGGLASAPSVNVGERPALSDVTADEGAPAPEVAPEPGGEQPDSAQAAPARQRTLESRFLSRGAGEAAAIGGIWMLFVAAIATAIRRTSLLQLLSDR